MTAISFSHGMKSRRQQSRSRSGVKDDIRFARDNVRKFAEAQKETISDIEVEIIPGFVAGQKAIPCQAAGLLRARRTVRAYRFGDHDRDNRECRGGAGISRHVRRRDRIQASIPRLSIRLTPAVRTPFWRSAACRALRPWRSACSGFPNPTSLVWPRQPVRCRSQADSVWPGRHRHAGGPDGQPDSRR